jgi:hypothetical protein
MMCVCKLLCFIFLCYASCGTAEELVLRPEHGIAFEHVGLLDNDMTIWHQTFIIPIPTLDIPVTRAAVSLHVKRMMFLNSTVLPRLL